MSLTVKMQEKEKPQKAEKTGTRHERGGEGRLRKERTWKLQEKSSGNSTALQ